MFQFAERAHDETFGKKLMSNCTDPVCSDAGMNQWPGPCYCFHDFRSGLENVFFLKGTSCCSSSQAASKSARLSRRSRLVCVRYCGQWKLKNISRFLLFVLQRMKAALFHVDQQLQTSLLLLSCSVCINLTSYFPTDGPHRAPALLNESIWDLTGCSLDNKG